MCVCDSSVSIVSSVVKASLKRNMSRLSHDMYYSGYIELFHFPFFRFWKLFTLWFPVIPGITVCNLQSTVISCKEIQFYPLQELQTILTKMMVSKNYDWRPQWYEKRYYE